MSAFGEHRRRKLCWPPARNRLVVSNPSAISLLGHCLAAMVTNGMAVTRDLSVATAKPRGQRFEYKPPFLNALPLPAVDEHRGRTPSPRQFGVQAATFDPAWWPARNQAAFPHRIGRLGYWRGCACCVSLLVGRVGCQRRPARMACLAVSGHFLQRRPFTKSITKQRLHDLSPPPSEKNADIGLERGRSKTFSLKYHWPRVCDVYSHDTCLVSHTPYSRGVCVRHPWRYTLDTRSIHRRYTLPPPLNLRSVMPPPSAHPVLAIGLYP